MTKANRFFDVLRQSFNRWSLIRFAMERCFTKARVTIFVDSRKQ